MAILVLMRFIFRMKVHSIVMRISISSGAKLGKLDCVTEVVNHSV